MTLLIKAVQQFMLGTVMNREKQAVQTLQAIREAGYDGIELCGFMIHPMNPGLRLLTKAAGMPVGNGGKLDWQRLIRQSGLQVVSLHLDLDTLERDLSAGAAEAAAFGTKYIVITGMYRFHYGSEDDLRALAERLNRAGRTLKEQGVELLYHNHNCELLRLKNGQTGYSLLLEETDPAYVNFEFDSYWFSEGGADPVAWMKKLDSRMKLWHINDRGSRVKGPSITPIVKTDSMELGTGNMPLDALSAQAKLAGCEAVILESHRNWIDGSPIKSLQRSAEYLHRSL